MARTELPLLVDEYGARLVDELDFRLEARLLMAKDAFVAIENGPKMARHMASRPSGRLPSAPLRRTA